MNEKSKNGFPRTFVMVLLLVAANMLLTGCRASKGSKTIEARNVVIEFSCFYRKDTTQPHSVEKKIRVKVEIVDGPVPEIGRPLEPVRADVGDFQVVLMPNTNMCFLDVYEIKNKEIKNKKKYLFRHLYQLDGSIRNQFSGSHGFTGLIYVHHSENESELQLIGKVVK